MTDGFVESGGNSAFPRAEGETTPALEGMTLRDYFAGQALAGLATNQVDADITIDANAKVASAWAYSFADAMLKQREGE